MKRQLFGNSEQFKRMAIFAISDGLCKILLNTLPTFQILGTLMQHVVLCQMENRVFFYFGIKGRL